MPRVEKAANQSEFDSMTPEQMRAMLQEMKEGKETAEAEAKRIKDMMAKAVYLKVSEKGGASLYGIRRFPITFYVEEWERILDMEPDIRAFLKEHKDELATRKPNGDDS